MNKNKRLWSLDLVIVLLALSCVVLAVALVISNPLYIPFVIFIFAVLACVVIANIKKVRGWVRRLIGSKSSVRNMGQNAFSSLHLPMVVTSEDIIIWYNQEFKKMMGFSSDLPIISMSKLLPALNAAQSSGGKGQSITCNDKQYTAYGGTTSGKASVYFAVFIDDTDLKIHSNKYHLSRPSVMYFVIDTYDSLIKEVRESERNRIIAEVDSVLDKYISAENGFIRKLDNWNYIAIVEEQGMRKFITNRFRVLDEVAKIDGGSSQIGLSGGVGRLGETLVESEQMAAQALDMALGRGGNQIALKEPGRYSFFGGVTQSVEQKSKVRGRVMAKTIATEIEKADRVLIMGHKNSDMDSLGACMGMWRFSKYCGKNATIVFNQRQTMAGALYNYLCNAGYEEEFMSPEHAAPLVNDNTMLIIVDTHVPYLLESNFLLEKCKTIAVIDHHRKMVNHIASADVFYHDTTASSASEMVSEMLGQLSSSKEVKLKVAEANALLAGILLDTRVFSLHVGVHTFEAAAYLKSAGAQTEVAKSFFSTSIENYVQRSRLVAHAAIYHGFAISVGDEAEGEDIDVIAAQSANDLLTITDVKASIVAVKKADYIQVSARSMGEINVQLIMEKLGGGGHLTMAAAQVKDTDIESIMPMLTRSIDEYINEHMIKTV